ncbi:hypothetical protein BDP27DRAFT_1336050 [Rhodocollybia butyracea]|uniref:Heterokaryon incompatibility domain-containing protein n=1 Tax=Rhodocollybia butyracea TaxID=206335 RepID=A0A9P5PGP2_9AGAR|nr:hypothetical protein BDP27DRAFT_1336050 [Rhodocollybia butyracea]
MCNIYQNAYVTIIAACSKKAGDGFLHNRRNPVSTALPFWLPSGELGTIHVRDQERAPQNEPVNQRAWCFQERVLSSRALIYASHTVQFQCYSGIKNIGGGNNYLPVAKTDGLRIPIDLLPTGNAQSKWYVKLLSFPRYVHWVTSRCLLGIRSVRCQNVAAVAKASNVDVLDRELTLYEQRTWRTWKDILAEYTRRSITNPADKLVALAGVAEAIQRRWLQKSEYLAGLWYQTLAQDLIWHRYQCADRRSRPQGYRAPSWSWAATDGPISDGAWPGIIEPVISFQSCTTLPAISSLPFGEIRGGTLVAKAIVRCVSWGQNSLEANEAPLYELCNGLRREVGFVYHDCAGSEPIEGFAVVVGEFNKRVTRVGLFNVHQQITDPDAS